MAVGRKSVVIISAQALSAILGAVALAFIGRFVAPSEMGQVAYALALTGLVASFAQAGLNQAHVRKVHGHALDACHGALFWLRTRIALVVFTLAAAAFLAWHLWRGFQDTSLGLIALAMLYRILHLQRSSYVASFNAWQHTARAQAVPLLDSLTRAPAVILVTILLGTGQLSNAPPWISGTYLIGSAVGLILAVRWFKATGYVIGHSTPELRREYLKFGLPLAFSAIITQWIIQMDTVMIGFFGTAADVGSYFAASRIIQMALVFPIALGTLLLPTFAKLVQAGEPLRGEAGRALRRLAMLMMPGFALLALYPDEVLRIAVGGRYTNAAPALRWLAIYGIIATARVIPLTLAKANNLTKIALQASLLNLGTNVVLNTLLIPKSVLGYRTAGLGIEGAAIATLAAQLLAFLYILWTQRKHMQWHFAFLAGTVGALAWIFSKVPLGWFNSPTRIWEFATMAALFYIGSFAVFRLTGLLQREDIELAADAIHPRKFLQYIREELRFRPPS